MEEIWKPIEGYEGFYEVSNMGRVRSVNRIINLKGKRAGQTRVYEGRELKPLCSQEHLLIRLQKEGQKENIGLGRLVANHFVDGFKESGRIYVRYKDGNYQNCAASNLE